MAFLEDVGKVIGNAANGVGNVANGIGNAAQSVGKAAVNAHNDFVRDQKERKTAEMEKAAEERRKCPLCGERLGVFQRVCPSCGNEVRNIGSSFSVQQFSEKLEEIEKRRKPYKEPGDIAKRFGVEFRDHTDEKIVNHIRGYEILPTKEDIYAFMILASSKIDTAAFVDESIKEKNAAWISKFEEAFTKARLLFEKDMDFTFFQEVYDELHRRLQEGKAIRDRALKADRKKEVFLVIVVIVIFCALVVACILGQ